MKARAVKGYNCPVCSELHRVKDNDKVNRYFIPSDAAEEVNDGWEEGYASEEEPQLIEMVLCPEGEIFHKEYLDEGTLELFMCGECEALYEDREEAKECCK